MIYAMTDRALGLRIRRARERKRLTQQQLADAVGASVRAVGSWERGEAVPRNTIGALDAVLGVALDSGEEPDPREEELRNLVTGVLPDDEVEQWITRYRTQRDKHRAG
jgi:transcriptional regulator with XRE-family HTH domain